MEETLNFKQNPSISRTSAMHMVCRLCSALICVFWRYSLDFKIDGATHVDLVIKTIGLHIEIPCKRHWIRCTSWRRFKLSKINLTMFRMSLLSLNMKCFFPSPPPPLEVKQVCAEILIMAFQLTFLSYILIFLWLRSIKKSNRHR